MAKETYRKAESIFEKGLGGALTLLGVISVDYPMVAVGLAIFFIGRWREPKN